MTSRGVGPVLLLMVVLALSACGGSDSPGSAPTQDPTGSATAPSTAAATGSDQAPTPIPNPGAPDTSATTAGQETSELPGEDFLAGPPEGTTFAVVGVAADDTLNVRAVPGTAGDIVGSLAPLADDVEVTGRARLVNESVWYEVGGAQEGWVNAGFLAALGETTDITSELDDRPTAETLDELADVVTGMRAPTEAETDALTMVIVDGPTVGDLGEVTVDILGFADDAIRGERLHLFAQPPADNSGFTLRTVERTLLCARGVSDGLCS